MRTVLAIVATARTQTPEATEFLRVIVALCACAVPVEIVETGAGVGALSREAALTEDGERFLKGLAANGIAPARATDLAARIEAASDVLRLVDHSPVTSQKKGVIVRWRAIQDLPDAVERALAAETFLRR